MAKAATLGTACVAYDEGLAERVQGLARLEGLTVKRMFGGWGLMWRGNLLVGVIGDDLIARVGPDAYTAALTEPGAREFDFTGRPMKGWVQVEAEAVAEDPALQAWLERAQAFVATLPSK